MREIDAFARQLIQMRRMRKFRTVDTDGVPPHLIRHDQQDIGFCMHIFARLINY